MPWLFIDTHEAGTMRAGLISQTERKLRMRKGRSSALLPFLADILHSTAIKRLEGICVVAGPGSFSSIRSGVLVANLLSRLLNIPLVRVAVGEEPDFTAHTSFVAPIYDAEPNITHP